MVTSGATVFLKDLRACTVMWMSRGDNSCGEECNLTNEA